MGIFRRKRLGYILVVILVSVCLVDFITTILISSIDQGRPYFLMQLDELGKEDIKSELRQKIDKREWDVSLLERNSHYNNKSFKVSFMENIRNFFIPANPYSQNFMGLCSHLVILNLLCLVAPFSQTNNNRFCLVNSKTRDSTICMK